MKSKRFAESCSKREVLSFLVNKSITVITLSLAALMIFAVWLQMLARWIISPYFGISLPWTGSLSTMMLVFLTFIGAGVASRDQDHIRISIVLDMLSKERKKAMNIVNSLLIILFLIVFISGSITQASEMTGRQYETLPVFAPFTIAWLYIAATVGGLMMLSYTIRDLIKNIMDGQSQIRKSEETLESSTSRMEEDQ